MKAFQKIFPFFTFSFIACFGLMLFPVNTSLGQQEALKDDVLAKWQDTIKNPNPLFDQSLQSVNMTAQDYVRIAFPKYTWFETVPEASPSYVEAANIEQFLNRTDRDIDLLMPWARKYIKRPNGRPKFDGLSRWPSQRNVKVSFGWPPVRKSVSKSPPNDVAYPSRWHKSLYTLNEQHEDVVGELKPHLKSLLSEISGITKRSFEVVNQNEENVENPAQIRIILTEYFYRDNKFKSLMGHDSRISHQKLTFPFVVQDRFIDAVRYTPMIPSQVEGYYLTDHLNNIEFAACYIWPHHPIRLIKALVTECLLRSMGLPEVSFHVDSMLSLWNNEYQNDVRLRILDGMDVNRTSEVPALIKTALYARLEEAIEIKDFKRADAIREEIRKFDQHLDVSDKNHNIEVAYEIPPYDKIILRAHYDDQLGAGLSRLDVIKKMSEY